MLFAWEERPARGGTSTPLGGSGQSLRQEGPHGHDRAAEASRGPSALAAWRPTAPGGGHHERPVSSRPTPHPGSRGGGEAQPGGVPAWPGRRRATTGAHGWQSGGWGRCCSRGEHGRPLGRAKTAARSAPRGWLRRGGGASPGLAGATQHRGTRLALAQDPGDARPGWRGKPARMAAGALLPVVRRRG